MGNDVEVFDGQERGAGSFKSPSTTLGEARLVRHEGLLAVPQHDPDSLPALWVDEDVAADEAG